MPDGNPGRKRAPTITAMADDRHPDTSPGHPPPPRVPERRRSRDAGDRKTDEPIAEKGGETGSPVVLVRAQVRIGEDAHGYEEEPVSQPLIGSGQCKVCEIGGGSEGTVVPHRGADR